MGAPVLSSTEELCFAPFLIKKYTFTTGNTATAFTHGGPAVAPDLAISQLASAASADPGSDTAVYALTSTQFTLDCEDDGNDTCIVYLIWVDASAGGIS